MRIGSAHPAIYKQARQYPNDVKQPNSALFLSIPLHPEQPTADNSSVNIALQQLMLTIVLFADGLKADLFY